MNGSRDDDIIEDTYKLSNGKTAIHIIKEVHNQDVALFFLLPDNARGTFWLNRET